MAASNVDRQADAPPPPAAGGGQIRPGREARAFVANVCRLYTDCCELLSAPRARQADVQQAFKVVREARAREQLSTIPVERLRDATGGRLRLGVLRDAGYGTVADVARARASELRRIPGVGEQTAAQALAAARQLLSAVQEDVPVRLDPDMRSAQDTRLLSALHAYEQVDRAVSSLLEPAAALVAQAEPLLEPASRAASRLKLMFRPGTKREALAATTQLQALMSEPWVADLALELPDALAGCPAEPPAAEDLWRDYELRAPEYYGLLGEVADLDLDVDAAQGFVPGEIATRVNEQQLDDTFLRVSLRGYQAFGAKFALVQRRSILGDEMGLGKTIEAIAALAHLQSIGATHFMVVCPASVLVNWTQEIARRSELRAYRVHGNDRAYSLRTWVRQGGVAVATIDSLRTLAPPEDLNLAMLVIDEAHYVKNPHAKRSKAARQWIEPAERTLFLTGTPMENRVDEFRTLVSYLQPDVAASIRDHDGLAGANAFRKAVAPVYLRRNQDDVLAELPDKLAVEDWVELSAADLAAYRVAVASGNFMAMRRAAFAAAAHEGSAKLARLLEIVEESAASGWKVVVFSYFRDVLSAVEHAVGANVIGKLTGSVPPPARQELVDEFTAVDGHAVLVSQIQAGGVGLNLQAASVVILTEPQWKPTIEEQAISRCHRMGQVRRVHVHRLLADDSVDRRMVEILERKAALFDEYVRKSDLKDASPDAVDISDIDAAHEIVSEAQAERDIIAMEQERLGLTASD